MKFEGRGKPSPARRNFWHPQSPDEEASHTEVDSLAGTVGPPIALLGF